MGALFCIKGGSILIEVSHLTKRYGDHTALSDLSFSIEKGQIYGFLGPNGAGKSTTMNIMTGCLAATSGQVKIGGYDIFEEAAQAKRLIGYLPEQPPLYLDRTPEEYLTFVARAKKIPKEKIEAEVDRVLEVTQTDQVAHRLIKHLSKGFKQRVGIAQALLGDPEVIILDEPTVGLDPAQIIGIRNLISDLGKDHTVILSSHILSEVQAICSTILIISQGKLVACDTPENLETLFAGSTTLELVAEGTEEAIRSALAPILLPQEVTPAEDGTCRIRLELEGDNPRALQRDIFFAFADASLAILQMTTAKASLEDIFLELTTGDDPEEETGEEDNQ